MISKIHGGVWAACLGCCVAVLVGVNAPVGGAVTKSTKTATTQKSTAAKKSAKKTTSTVGSTVKAGASPKNATLHAVQLDVIEASLIKSQQEASPSLTVGKAVCERVTKAPVGRTKFTCDVNVEGTPVPYRVTLDIASNGAGSFTTKALKVPIDTRSLKSLVRSVLNEEVRDDAVIDCGPRRVVVVDPGAVLRCSAELGDERELFSFTVKDMEGNVEMQRK
jgi:hypothetical protein